MLVYVGLDDSDELFKDLDELIMNADLDECEEEKKVVEEGREMDMDEEILELLGEEVGLGIECLGIDIDNITSDMLEDFLNIVDNPDPNEKIEQGERASKEQGNAISTRSGFGYGEEEERNGNKNEKTAETGTNAPHSFPMRRIGSPEGFPVVVGHSIASQSYLLRRNDPEQPENDPKAHLEVGNHVGDEPMVYIEDKTPKSTPILPTKAYEQRKEDSLDMELQELLGMEMGKVDDTIDVNITLDEFERMFDINESPDLVNEITDEGGKKLEPEMKVEKETIEEVDGETCTKLKVNKGSTSKSKGVLMKPIDEKWNDIVRAKYGGEDVYPKQLKKGSIMRETKEWNDAWAKTRMEFDVSNYEILFDDLICRCIGECYVLKNLHEERNRGKLRFQC